MKAQYSTTRQLDINIKPKVTNLNETKWLTLNYVYKFNANSFIRKLTRVQDEFNANDTTWLVCALISSSITCK